MAINPLIRKIVLDILVLIAVIASFVILRLVWKQPYRRGYFAEDLSIRLPYKSNTVSFRLLTIVAFIINIFTILATECCLDKKDSVIPKYYLIKLAISGWVWNSYIIIGIFGFGVACQQLAVDIAKLVIGRLRPHFYDMYVQSKVNWSGSKLLRHGFQITVLMLAWYVCLSRVSDHMHYWDDVATGMILGVIPAVLVVNYILLSEMQKPKLNTNRMDSFDNRFQIYKFGLKMGNTY